MDRQEAGFTLIELVMVIVILSVVAAAALPQFIDLQDEAGTAAVAAVAGTITSASAINQAALAVNSPGRVVTANRTCQAAAAALLEGGIPTGYNVTGSGRLSGTNNVANSCRVRNTDTGALALATIISVN